MGIIQSSQSGFCGEIQDIPESRAEGTCAAKKGPLLPSFYETTLHITSPKHTYWSVLELSEIVEEVAHKLEDEYQLELNWRIFFIHSSL